MRKRIVSILLVGTMIIGTATACGSNSGGEPIDLKDPDGEYHVQVDFKTNEVKLSCTATDDGAGTRKLV